MNYLPIDVHCHVTAKNLMNNIIDLERNNDIQSIFLLPTYFPKKGNGVSNFRLYHNIKDKNKFKMYLSLDFSYFWMYYNEMIELLDDDRDKIVGIKIYTGYQDNIDLESKEMNLILELAAKYDLPIMFHTGYTKGDSRHNIYYCSKLIDLIENSPKNKFILAHLSNPSTNDLINMMNTFDNVYTDISGLMEDSERFDENDRDLFMHVFNSVDKTKILYGSDYPVQTHEQTNKLLDLLSEEDKNLIKYGNAMKLFKVNYEKF